MSPFSNLLSLVCTTGISNGGCYRGALLRCQLRTPNQRACFHNSHLELLSVADEQPARRPSSATATQRPRPHPRATRFPSMPLTCNLNLLLPSMHSPSPPLSLCPSSVLPCAERRNTQHTTTMPDQARPAPPQKQRRPIVSAGCCLPRFQPNPIVMFHDSRARLLTH